MIELWELRNTEVHGKEENHKQKVRKDRASKIVRELHGQQDLTRPSDGHLFHPNVDEYIEESEAIQLKTYVQIHTAPIMSSIKKWAENSTKRVETIMRWFQPETEEGLIRIFSRQRNGLMYDAYSKKKRRKKMKNKGGTGEPTWSQVSLTGFLSLQQNLY